MFGLPYGLIIKLGLAAVVAAIIGFHFLGDSNVKDELQQTKELLEESNLRYKDLQDQFLQATTASKVYADQATASDKARAKIEADLSAALSKLRGQKPPTQCKEAIEWSIQNKGDLKW